MVKCQVQAAICDVLAIDYRDTTENIIIVCYMYSESFIIQMIDCSALNEPLVNISKVTYNWMSLRMH